MPKITREDVPHFAEKAATLTGHAAIGTQGKLAELAGVSKAAMTGYITGDRGPLGEQSLPSHAVTALSDRLAFIFGTEPQIIRNAFGSADADAFTRFVRPSRGQAWQTLFETREAKASLSTIKVSPGLRAVAQDPEIPGEEIKQDQRFRLKIDAPNTTHVALLCESNAQWQFLGLFERTEPSRLLPPPSAKPYFLDTPAAHRFVVIAAHRPLPDPPNANGGWPDLPTLDLWASKLAAISATGWTWGEKRLQPI